LTEELKDITLLIKISLPISPALTRELNKEVHEIFSNNDLKRFMEWYEVDETYSSDMDKKKRLTNLLIMKNNKIFLELSSFLSVKWVPFLPFQDKSQIVYRLPSIECKYFDSLKTVLRSFNILYRKKLLVQKKMETSSRRSEKNYVVDPVTGKILPKTSMLANEIERSSFSPTTRRPTRISRTSPRTSFNHSSRTSPRTSFNHSSRTSPRTSFNHSSRTSPRTSFNHSSRTSPRTSFNHSSRTSPRTSFNHSSRTSPRTSFNHSPRTSFNHSSRTSPRTSFNHSPRTSPRNPTRTSQSVCALKFVNLSRML